MEFIRISFEETHFMETHSQNLNGVGHLLFAFDIQGLIDPKLI